MSERSVIGQIFHFIGRSIDMVRVFLGRLIFLLLVLVVLGLLFSSPTPIQVDDNSLVVLAPKGAIVEQNNVLSVSDLLLGNDEFVDTPVQNILVTLAYAAEDDRVRGVVLELEELTSVSAANIERIGRALDDYKASGKALVAHGQFFTQAQYYLASYADTIYMHSMGQLMLPGYGGSQLFFSELLDNLGVTMHIFRVGTHKAAVEPFTLNGMSDESRQNNQQLIDELWQRYTNQIARNRGLTPEQVQQYAQDYSELLLAANGDTARVAVEQQLIDELLTPRQLELQLSQIVGGANASQQSIAYDQYLAANASLELASQSEIGVIVAQGAINIGEQPRGVIGADSLNQLIAQARNDDSIKAVVLRVDSPGGSAFASELIRQELVELQKAGKPLVVSMGGVAASGGYWISATADEIWASPATITGSIGIFSMIPTFENSMAKIGVYADGVGTTPYSRADVLSGMNEELATVLQASIEQQYRNFLQLVAQGRGLEVDAVDAVAQGQVWTGTQAMAFGLVDNLGDLDDAILAAARIAGVDDYTWRYIEKPLSAGEQFAQQMITSLSLQASLQSLQVSMQGPVGQVLKGNSNVRALQDTLNTASQFLTIKDPRNNFAVCEFCVSLLR